MKLYRHSSGDWFIDSKSDPINTKHLYNFQGWTIRGFGFITHHSINDCIVERLCF